MLKHNGNIDSSVKEHYKMYKAGKKWLFAGIFAAVLSFGGFVSTAQADTANQQPQVVQTKTVTTDKVAPTSSATSQASTASSQASSTDTQKSAAPASSLTASKSQASVASTTKSSVSNAASQASTFLTNSEAAKSVYVSTSKATKANDNNSTPASQQRTDSTTRDTNTTVNSSTTTTASSAPASQAKTTATVTVSAPKATSNVSKTDVKNDQPASQAKTIELLAEPNSASPVSTTSTSNTSESSTSNAASTNSVDTVSDYKPATTDNITNWGISNDWQRNTDTWVGNQYTVQAFTNPSDATYHNLTVVSTDPTVATATLDPVTKKISIKALKPGQTTIQLNLLRDNNKTSIVSFDQAVHTPEKMQSVNFYINWQTEPGTVQTLNSDWSGGLSKDTARFDPTNFTLTSSDPTVASINGHTITSLKAGSTYIKLSTVFDGQTFTNGSTLTVYAPSTSLSNANVPVGYYEDLQPNLTVHGFKDPTAYNFTLTSKNPDIATITGSKITGVKAGTATITIGLVNKSDGKLAYTSDHTVNVVDTKDWFNYLTQNNYFLSSSQQPNSSVFKGETRTVDVQFNDRDNENELGDTNIPINDPSKYHFQIALDDPTVGTVTDLGTTPNSLLGSNAYRQIQFHFVKSGVHKVTFTGTDNMGDTKTQVYYANVVDIPQLETQYQPLLPKDTMALNDEQYVSNLNVSSPYTTATGWNFQSVTTDTPDYLSVNYSGYTNATDQAQYLVTALKATPQDNKTFAHLTWNYTNVAGESKTITKDVNVIDLIQAKSVAINAVPKIAYQNIALEPLQLSVTPLDSVKYLAPYQWVVAQKDGKGDLVPVTDNDSIYKISGDVDQPIFTFLKSGNFTIQASVTDKRTIALGSQTTSIDVKDYVPLQRYQINVLNRLQVGKQSTFEVGAPMPSNAVFESAWTSSDPTIASVTYVPGTNQSQATITGLKAGKVTITLVTSQEGNNVVTNTIALTVFDKVAPTSVMRVTGPTAVYADSSSTYQLVDATGNPVHVDQWTSSDPYLNNISQSGQLYVSSYVVAPKSVVLGAKSGTQWYYLPVQILTANETVKETLNNSDYKMAVGDHLNLDLSHVSDVSLVKTTGDATLTTSGELVATKPGEIEVDYVDTQQKKQSKAITIVADQAINNVSLNYTGLNNGTAYMGNVLTPTLTFNPQDSGYQSVEWVSSNSKVATVNNEGIVHALLPGTATITATVKDVNGKSFVTSQDLSVGLNPLGLNNDQNNDASKTAYAKQINDYSDKLQAMGYSLQQLFPFGNRYSSATPADLTVSGDETKVVTTDGTFTMNELTKLAVDNLDGLAKKFSNLDTLSFKTSPSADYNISSASLGSLGYRVDENSGWASANLTISINSDEKLSKQETINKIEHLILNSDGVAYPETDNQSFNKRLVSNVGDLDMLSLILEQKLGSGIDSTALGV